jgi:hypothetical protein
VSKYIDINQLLDDIATSSRSASDPWTLSRSGQSTIKRDISNPAVVGDMGQPMEQVQEGIQRSLAIAAADARETRKAPVSGDSESWGSRILGGLLDAFPIASAIGALFGFGGEDAPSPTVTSYSAPPAIHFEGALSGHGTSYTALSYGADGRPRLSQTGETTAASKVPVAGSNFISGKEELVGLAAVAGNGVDTPSSRPSGESGLTAEIESLAGQPFTPEPSSTASLSSITSVESVQGAHAFPEATSSSSSVEDLVTSSPGSREASSRAQNILVQVQAMDSQSFMDHSHEIAQAVRQAMLNMNSLNDVILDL